jgi:zinc protease
MMKYLTCTVISLLILAKAAFAVGLPLETFTLASGLRLIVIEDSRAPVVLHAIAYRVGGADEEKGKTGLAHFFEHLMFKGTERFPQDRLNALFDENGMERNAFTMQDTTLYYARGSVASLEALMEMEADRMTNLAFSPAMFETERKVVQEERRLNTESNPYGLAYEKLSAELFAAHPYGRPVIGRPEDVAALTLADAQAFYRRHYRPDNAIVIVVGDVRPAEAYVLAERHYGKLPASEPQAAVERAAEPRWAAPRRLNHRDHRISTTSVIRRSMVPARNVAGERQSAAFEVLANILGGSMQSRFRAALVIGTREAMSVGAYYNGMQKTYGDFSLTATASPGADIEGIEKKMLAILKDVARSGPTEAEVERAKNTVAAAYIYGLDNPANVGVMMGLALTTDVPLQAIYTREQTFADVTVADVKAAALLLVENMNTVTLTLGPQKP